MKYDASFREEVTLADGTSVVVRMSRPEDKELLRRGFERLSPSSRYLRFFAAKRKLSEGELRYLIEVDQVDHVALGVVRETDGVEEGLGIARFIRDHEDPEVGEPAVAVVDHAQGNGIGSLLLHHLTAAAIERGIRRFHCEVLADNEPMKHLLEEIGPTLSIQEAGVGVLDVMIALPDTAPDSAHGARPSPLHRVLAHVARQALSIKLGRRLLTLLGLDKQ